MANAKALLADIPGGDVVPLPAIRDRVGWSRYAQSDAVKAGLIQPVDERGPQQCYQVRRADAVEIVLAGIIAQAGGIRPTVVLRAIRGAGLDPAALARCMTR